MMKKIIAGCAIAALMGTPASAADLPLKAVSRVAAPAWSWTGFYVGANAGWAWSRGGNGESCFDALSGDATGCAIVPDSGLKGNGFLGGGQIGYNWRAGAWVLGLEADIQAANIRASRRVSGAFPDVGVPGPGPFATFTASQRIKWFGTLRPRVGVLATSNLLLYVTAGLIYGEVQTAQDLDFTIASFPAVSSVTRAGGIFGGGMEWAFDPRWSLKVEGLHYDLGNVATAATQVPIPSPFTDFKTFGFHGAIARVGLSLHL